MNVFRLFDKIKAACPIECENLIVNKMNSIEIRWIFEIDGNVKKFALQIEKEMKTKDIEKWIQKAKIKMNSMIVMNYMTGKYEYANDKQEKA